MDGKKNLRCKNFYRVYGEHQTTQQECYDEQDRKSPRNLFHKLLSLNLKSQAWEIRLYHSLLYPSFVLREKNGPKGEVGMIWFL